MKKLVEKFELLGQVSDVLVLSIPRRSLELGIPQTSIDLDNVYFQQDGATCPTNNEAIDLLREKFPDRVISRRGDTIGHRAYDLKPSLKPCDLFLWSHVKDKVYANSPAPIQDLKDGIREAIEDIGQPLCDLVIENFIKRI